MIFNNIYEFIIEDLGDIVGSFLNIIFAPLSSINPTPAIPYIRAFMNFVKAALCILPAGTIATILSIILTYISVRLFINIIRTVWELIPWL